ncbi:MAG: hypothetical protein ACI97B_000053 [Verrucomicrobiales bacterium]|jgi:hypothetical protein
MPETETKPNAWLARLPELDGGRSPAVPNADADQLFDDILAAGKDGVRSIIAALNDVDDGADWKARYTLRGLASHTGTPERKADRKQLEAIYAGALSDDRADSVKTFLVMQLQYFAGADSVSAVAAQLKSEDPILIAAAAATLTAIGQPAAKAMKDLQSDVGERARAAIDHALMQISRNLG